jgi:hypothetical protein
MSEEDDKKKAQEDELAAWDRKVAENDPGAAVPVRNTPEPAPDEVPPMLRRPPEETPYSKVKAAQVASDQQNIPSAPPAEVPLTQKLEHSQDVYNDMLAKGQISDEEYKKNSAHIAAMHADAVKAEAGTTPPAAVAAPRNKEDGPGLWETLKGGANRLVDKQLRAVQSLGAYETSPLAAAGLPHIDYPRDPAAAATPAPSTPVDTSKSVDFKKSGVDSKPPTPPQTTTNVAAQRVPRVAPPIAGMIRQGEVGQMTGVGEQEAAEAAQADELAAAKEQAAEDMRIQQMLDKQDRDNQRDGLDTHLAQIQARSDAIAAKKINPHEFFDKMSFGEKILGAIGMALSGGLEGFTRRPNSGDALILKGINDSIDAQKANLENDRHGLDSDKDLYAQKFRLFDDDQKAKAAVRQEALAAAVQQIDALAAKYNSPIIHARADQLKGQLLQQFGHDQATLETYIPAHQVTSGGPAGGAGGYTKFERSEVVEYPPGSGRWISIAKDDRERVLTQMNAASSIHQAAEEVRGLAKVPVTKRGPSWMQQYDAAREILAKAEQAAGGRGGVGILNKNEEAVGGRKFLIFNPGVSQSLDLIERNADQTRDAYVAHAAQYDITPILVPKKNKDGLPEVETWYRLNGEYRAGPAASTKRSELDSISAPVGSQLETKTAPATTTAKGASPTEAAGSKPAPIEKAPKSPTSTGTPTDKTKGKNAGKGLVPNAPASSFNLPKPK